MKEKNFKIFKTTTRNLRFVEYDTSIPYYSYLKKQQSLGLNQFLFTSNLMILMALSLVKEQNEIISVDLYDDSYKDAAERFINLFKSFADKKVNETDLYKHLDYLEYEFSIDIVTLKFRNNSRGIFTLRSNGTMTIQGEIDQWQEVIMPLLLKNWDK